MRKFVCDICKKDIVMDPDLVKNMIDVIFEIKIVQRNENRFTQVLSTNTHMTKEACRECKEKITAFVDEITR